jgi:hypothetical protein
MEPVGTLTAAAIATLVFTKAIEKTVETLTESTLNKLKHLREKIWQKFKGNQKLETYLAKAQEGSKTDVDLLAAHLQVAMDTDPKFAQEVQKLAEEINQKSILARLKDGMSRMFTVAKLFSLMMLKPRLFKVAAVTALILTTVIPLLD